MFSVPLRAETGRKRCSIDGCSNIHKARGLCMHHYNKARKAGKFTPGRQAKAGLPLAERFAFIGCDIRANGCWDWKGATRNGYGRIGREPGADHDILAHRVSYSTYIDRIPGGMSVHHTCANRRCVNPDHLELATSRANVAEMMERSYYRARIKQLEDEIADLRSRLRDFTLLSIDDQSQEFQGGGAVDA